MVLPEPLNADYIDAQYRLWKENPMAVPRDWRFFFEGFTMAQTGTGHTMAAGECSEDRVLRQAKVDALTYRYRDLGHLLACMDPLEACPIEHPLLDLSAFGLNPENLQDTFYIRGASGNETALLKDIIGNLKATYCRSVGVEYMHLQDPAERLWLRERMEPVLNRPEPSPEQRRRILEKLRQAARFEQFLNKKYVAVTRFSLEGGDVIVPMLDVLTDHAAGMGCREIILGMAHRGRLNVQTHILGKPYAEIFGEFESCYDPENLVGAGDVKYHNGYLADIRTFSGSEMRIFLANNPSHLEAVDPVVEGIARARQDRFGEDAAGRVLPLLIHGDAAFSGQGVVFETLNMSQLTGYRTGGTIHLIINNQIGYTTLPEDARSTRYATDVAKMLMVPIFHVHGENPEAAVHIMRLAADYRMTFNKDVVIDVVCYRRYGHNEGDEPYFTQPLMVERIRTRPSPDRLYADRLMEAGVVDETADRAMTAAIDSALNDAFDEIHGSACLFPQARYFEDWKGFHGRYPHSPVKTGVSKKKLKDLARKLNRIPEAFSLNRKLKGLLLKRRECVEAESGIDWANAESLAFGSLLTEGVPIRLSGQDCGRGTFAQRHSVLVDTRNGQSRIPLNGLGETGAKFEVYNSHLAEYAVLGFEYGHSITRPDVLTIWEAQFGDFVNTAQAVIDLFIASGQSKWQRLSGLVLLLPHGFDGLGPEHSSARPERFLQLCAEDNMQVCNPSTPGQYFHLLRRQIKRDVRKPLVVLTPKSLLRNPLAVSKLSDLSTGYFREVIDDPTRRKTIDRVILCSGKIYYELLQRQRDLKRKEIAIVRLEQFYPFPDEQMDKIVAKYGRSPGWIWVQEEPENMGGWRFVRPLLEHRIGGPVQYIGRPAAASPATGFPKIYRKQQAAVTDEAVGPASKKTIETG